MNFKRYILTTIIISNVLLFSPVCKASNNIQDIPQEIIVEMFGNIDVKKDIRSVMAVSHLFANTMIQRCKDLIYKKLCPLVLPKEPDVIKFARQMIAFPFKPSKINKLINQYDYIAAKAKAYYLLTINEKDYHEYARYREGFGKIYQTYKDNQNDYSEGTKKVGEDLRFLEKLLFSYDVNMHLKNKV